MRRSIRFSFTWSGKMLLCFACGILAGTGAAAFFGEEILERLEELGTSGRAGDGNPCLSRDRSRCERNLSGPLAVSFAVSVYEVSGRGTAFDNTDCSLGLYAFLFGDRLLQRAFDFCAHPGKRLEGAVSFSSGRVAPVADLWPGMVDFGLCFWKRSGKAEALKLAVSDCGCGPWKLLGGGVSWLSALNIIKFFYFFLQHLGSEGGLLPDVAFFM